MNCFYVLMKYTKSPTCNSYMADVSLLSKYYYLAIIW